MDMWMLYVALKEEESLLIEVMGVATGLFDSIPRLSALCSVGLNDLEDQLTLVQSLLLVYRKQIPDIDDRSQKKLQVVAKRRGRPPGSKNR